MIDATDGADIVHGAIANGSGTSSYTVTANTINGNGTTTLTYEDLTSPLASIKVELSANRVSEYYNGILYAKDAISEIRSVIGSAGNDTFSGGGAGETLDGGNGNDWLIGGSGADMLIGGNGNDTLNGGQDNYSETLVGGAGNDFYVLGDRDVPEYVIENVNGGIDTVDAWFSYTLTANVENLNGRFNATFTGNNLDNTITGDDFNQTIDGGAGADTMIGGNGDDVYYVDNLGDVITEINGTVGGNDTVYISVANFDGSKLANVEQIVLVGNGSISTGDNVAPVIGGVTAPVTIGDHGQAERPAVRKRDDHRRRQHEHHRHGHDGWRNQGRVRKSRHRQLQCCARDLHRERHRRGGPDCAARPAVQPDRSVRMRELAPSRRPASPSRPSTAVAQPPRRTRIFR